MISILTATCNQASYVDKCINSIRNSTFTDWELLILDDRSSDKTLNRVNKYPRKDSRIKIIPNKNKLYCGSAYKKLSKHAKGDIVCIVDGDDMIFKKSLNKIFNLYEKYPDIDYIYTQHWICSDRMKKLKRGVSCLPLEGKDIASSWEERKHCFSHLRTCRSKMLKYNLFKKGLKFSVDKYMGLMLESHGKGGFFNQPLYKWRTHPFQLTGRLRSERTKINKKCIKEIRRYRASNELEPQKIIEIL